MLIRGRPAGGNRMGEDPERRARSHAWGKIARSGSREKETGMTSMHASLRITLSASILLIGAAGVATSRAHAEGNDVVIAFRDVTAPGHCGVGYGRTLAEASVPKAGCQAGTIWEQKPMALAAAQAQHLAYIFPVVGADGTTVDNARTLQAAHDKLETLSSATSTMAATTVSPMVSCSGGPYYLNLAFGNGTVNFNAQARWFEQVAGGTCNFNQVNDQISQTGGSSYVEKWNSSWLDDTTGNQDQVSRGCQTIPFKPSYTGWQGGWTASHPNALWQTQADQTGGGCGNWSDTYLTGSMHLLEQ